MADDRKRILTGIIARLKPTELTSAMNDKIASLRAELQL